MRGLRVPNQGRGNLLRDSPESMVDSRGPSAADALCQRNSAAGAKQIVLVSNFGSCVVRPRKVVPEEGVEPTRP
jgi:hypothetical protein